MWIAFRYDGRDFQWCISYSPSKRLDVKSADGRYHVQCLIHEGASITGQNQRDLILAPTIIGPEFPIGSTIDHTPVSFDNAAEVAEHGVIHTDLVRSLMRRWENRSRYRLPSESSG